MVEGSSRYDYTDHMDPYGGYGSTRNFMDMPTKPLNMDPKKKTLNFVAMNISFFAPIIVFAVVTAVLSFSIHYSDPGVTWFVVILLAIVIVAFCGLAISTLRQRLNGNVNREPFWYLYLSAMLIIAWGFGIFIGEINWWNNTLPYNDLHTLSAHLKVDVNVMPGQQHMDVGRIRFVKGTKLDLTKSIGFKNVDQYCVVPIVGGNGAPLESYDYWAIGLNCCSGNYADFHCGDYNNPNARDGLRLMREDQRQFYRLAVQQAEATYNIKARHPLFFYWMQDSAAEMESYQAETVKSYFLALISFVFAQIFFLVIAVFSFTKLL